jgi:sigma-B regulation protein RsbU (phosphoserine phosphatase)
MVTDTAANEIISVFRRDEIGLFLSFGFVAVGLVSAVFTLLSRKLSPLLAWFSLFALLYGLRMWLKLDIVAMSLPKSFLLDRFRDGSSYLVPIPAFFYFEAAGFLSRHGKKIAYALTVAYLILFSAAFAFGRLPILEPINNVIVVVALTSLMVTSLRMKAADRDTVILRRGLMVFAVIVVYDNVGSLFHHFPNLDAYGFVIFLGTLGYVAARRTLQRDQQLGEIQKELDVARRIQMGNLPAAYRNSAMFRVATRYVPMTSVAGDFYDFLVADERQTGLLIADVSGHGVPAALIASMVKLAAASQRGNAGDPAALLTGMNDALCGNTQHQFVTAAYVYLDAECGRLRYSAAAHPPLLVVRNGRVTEIVENGLLLAAFPFATFTTVEHALLPGDRLLLYTDGIIEAANGMQEEFGQDRLQKLLCDGRSLSAEEMADRIIESVKDWAKSQEDDLTVMVCDYGPAASGG